MDVYLEHAFGRYYRQFPLVLVDIGASGGLQPNWEGAKEHLRVIAFEPDAREFENLVNAAASNSATYLNVALHEGKKTLDLHLTRRQRNSSIFKPNRKFLDKFPNPERFDILDTKQLETDTLDNQLRENQITDVDFIKVDTEGSEYFILQGAKGILSEAVFGLEIEVEFTQVYQDQPVFSDVDQLVTGLGFQLFDLRPYHWKRAEGKNYGKPKGQLVFADALYLRETESLIESLDRIEDETLRKPKVLKALSICVLYGYLDFALEVLGASGSLFNQDESLLLENWLRSHVTLSNRIPDFRGRGRLSDALYQLWKVLQPRQNRWARVGKELGNLE